MGRGTFACCQMEKLSYSSVGEGGGGCEVGGRGEGGGYVRWEGEGKESNSGVDSEKLVATPRSLKTQKSTLCRDIRVPFATITKKL